MPHLEAADDAVKVQQGKTWEQIERYQRNCCKKSGGKCRLPPMNNRWCGRKPYPSTEP
ncbi:unnamed protein product, partial [Musa banksii]